MLKTLRQRREDMLDVTKKKVSSFLDKELDTSEEIVPLSEICKTPARPLKNRMMEVPETQAQNTPQKRLDQTLTTVIPETPPEMRICPQSTRLCNSFRLNMSNLTLNETIDADSTGGSTSK